MFFFIPKTSDTPVINVPRPSGVADVGRVNSAITSANAAGGGIVQLQGGTYECEADVVMKSNVILQGIGEATVLRFTAAGTELNVSEAAHWKLRNLKVDTTGKSSGSNLEHSIRAFGVSDFEIYGVHVEAYAFGIFIGSADGGSVSENGSIHHCYLHGPCRNDLIGGGPASDTAPKVRNINVHDNFVAQDLGMSGASTYYTSMDMVAVDGITFKDNHCWGSVVFGSERDPHLDSSIKHNWVYPPLNNTTIPAAIYVDEGVNTGDQSLNLAIEDNFLYGGWIRVRGTTGQRLTKIRIHNNSVKNDPALTNGWLGILQRGISLTEVNNAVIEGNILDANGASGTTGIMLQDSSNAQVGGNTLISYAAAIEKGGTADNNDIGDNTFINCTAKYGTNVQNTLGLGTGRRLSRVEGRSVVDADADGATISATDTSGKLVTNEGATARADFTLPTAVVGYTYSFYCHDTDGIRVIAASGDTIRINASVSAAAGRIDSTTVGSFVTLVAINATEWVATSVGGTWAVT